MEDGATVPLFYENRTPELQLVNPDLNDAIYDVIDAAGLDEVQEDKLTRRSMTRRVFLPQRKSGALPAPLQHFSDVGIALS